MEVRERLIRIRVVMEWLDKGVGLWWVGGGLVRAQSADYDDKMVW